MWHTRWGKVLSGNVQVHLKKTNILLVELLSLGDRCLVLDLDFFSNSLSEKKSLHRIHITQIQLPRRGGTVLFCATCEQHIAVGKTLQVHWHIMQRWKQYVASLQTSAWSIHLYLPLSSLFPLSFVIHSLLPSASYLIFSPLSPHFFLTLPCLPTLKRSQPLVNSSPTLLHSSGDFSWLDTTSGGRRGGTHQLTHRIEFVTTWANFCTVLPVEWQLFHL